MPCDWRSSFSPPCSQPRDRFVRPRPERVPPRAPSCPTCRSRRAGRAAPLANPSCRRVRGRGIGPGVPAATPRPSRTGNRRPVRAALVGRDHGRQAGSRAGPTAGRPQRRVRAAGRPRCRTPCRAGRGRRAARHQRPDSRRTSPTAPESLSERRPGGDGRRERADRSGRVIFVPVPTLEPGGCRCPRRLTRSPSAPSTR